MLATYHIQRESMVFECSCRGLEVVIVLWSWTKG